MKKESLSVIFVRTFLAILLFAGMGTIIIGGAWLIGEYSKNKVSNQIVKPVSQEENYYDVLEKKCADDSCCVSSLKTMRTNSYKEADKNGKCSDGFNMNMMRCVTSYQWCEPIGENEIVEYEDKMKLSQSAEVLGILYPFEIIEITFYSDGGTTGVISKDANNKDFVFCLDGRIQINEIGKKIEPYHIYLKVGYPTDSNSQKISIAGEEEKALLNILQDWINKQVSKEEQIRLADVRTVVGLSEKELKIYRILKIKKTW